MKTTQVSASLAEKERIRIRIIAQVDEFLRRGGEINVLGNAGQSVRGRTSCGWQEQDDFPAVAE